MLLDTGSGCASPLSIDGVAFGVGTWSTSRVLTVQVGQTVLDRYSLTELPSHKKYHVWKFPPDSRAYNAISKSGGGCLGMIMGRNYPFFI